MRATAAILAALAFTAPAWAQPQSQTPDLQQRGQQLLQGLTGTQNQYPQQTPDRSGRGREETSRRPGDDRYRDDQYGNTQRSYRDQRQPDQGYRGQGDPGRDRYQEQRRSDQGRRGQDDRYGDTQRPYGGQYQGNQPGRQPPYDPGPGRSYGPPGYPPPPRY